ncbi:MAG: hypothetical protein ABR548_14620 [Actinomycetota bacterium]|nr:hypothetical protein [Actinomycetota bacterium]
MPGLLFGIGLLVVLVFVVAGYYSAKKHREELQAFAKRWRLEFSESDPFDLLAYPFRLFSLGEGRGVENVLWGDIKGLKVRLFEYWYYTTSTDAEGHSSRSYTHFTCGLAPVPANCPHLMIRRENVLTWIAEHVGFHDIEFESDEFNRAFRVKGDDRKFAYALIDARMMEWLLQTKGFEFEVNASFALVISGKLRVSELLNVVAALHGFCSHVPQVVPSLYPGAHGP